MNIITHPEYRLNLKKWELIRDAASSTGVKDGGTKYLPFVGSRENEDDRTAYQNYLERAQFYGFTQETLSGLLGLAFRDGIEIEQPGLDYILDDIDGDGVGIEQQMKRALSLNNSLGRAGLLVDFPTVEGALTKAEQERLGANATITLYDAFNIKNWHTEKRGAHSVLTLVSLEELVDVADDDGLTINTEKQERRLILDDDGYRVELYHGDDVRVYEPKDSKGRRFNYIPFYFIGSVNNDHRVDEPPIYPIASLNIGHYRNSADYEHSVFMLQPQPWATGLTQTWVDSNLKGFRLGSNSLFVGPEGSSFGIAQPQPNSMAFEAMTHKQQVMVSLGAKLVNAQVSFNSASEAIIANASENSRLQTSMDNVEKAYNDALVSLAEFMGTSPAMVEIKTDLSAIMADPQMAQIMVQAWMSGLIAEVDARGYMRKVGLIDRQEDEIADDVRLENRDTLDL